MEEIITGEELADSLNAITLNIKINVIKEKLFGVKETLDMTTVDIPEFCKPVHQRFDTHVDNFIRDIIEGNTLDYYYQQALKLNQI